MDVFPTKKLITCFKYWIYQMNNDSRKIQFISISITFLTMAMVYYSFHIGRGIAERYMPLVDATMEIKVEATTALLWFEEAISGDESIDIEDIWTRLDQSEWYAQAMLDGDTNEEGAFLALHDPDLRIQIEEVIDGIHYFRQIAKKRWASQSTSAVGSNIDQQLDLAFLKFILAADSVESALQQVIKDELQMFKFTQGLLIVLILVLGIVIGVLLLRSNARRINNIAKLTLNERQLNKAKNQLLNVVNGAKLGYWDWYYQTGVHLVNDEWLLMLGRSRADISNHVSDWELFIHPDDKEFMIQTVQNHIQSGENYVAEFRMKHSDGRWIWIQGSGSVVEYDEDTQEPLRLCGTHQDITERKQAEEKFKLAASVFSHAREGISITNDRATIIDVNDAYCRITGFSREEAIGQNPNFVHSGLQSPEFYADMWQALKKEGYWSGEIWNRRKNGEVYVVMKTISAVHNEAGIVTHYVSLGNDITLMKEHQNQLEHIAHYDILTNLPNRSLLSDRLSQAMLQCRRHEQSLAVVFLDLDGFKIVNDVYGHDVGDKLLIAISVRMKNALREGDNLSRFGGDEFVAVLPNLTKVEDCEPLLERLLLAASAPVTLGDIVLNVSASIGVTLYPEDNVDADLLIRHADQAMYMAKDLGKNRYHLFDTVQDDAVKVQRESLEAIRNALDNHEFVLYYQPKVNMRTGVFTGVEALIRWQHPERGLLSPDEFLPVIESNPMSIEIGEWVIDTALTQISQWQTIGVELPVTTSVNVAALQLQQPDFTDRLTTLLAAHPGVDPSYLELEILETSAFEDVQHTSTIMNACMALGVKFALDDFGTGYSSLTYLRRLPANLIKIDQSFVRDMLSDADDLAIVEGVIALAKSFNREVIAEGVETIEHGTALLQLGCELAQGYGIAKPMPASEITAWIREWKPDKSWKVE